MTKHKKKEPLKVPFLVFMKNYITNSNIGFRLHLLILLSSII